MSASVDTSFQPYLQQIDSIEKSVDELERTVMLMDEYTRQLDGKFKLLSEREKVAMVAQVFPPYDVHPTSSSPPPPFCRQCTHLSLSLWLSRSRAKVRPRQSGGTLALLQQARRGRTSRDLTNE
jgi:hypothetical protein